MIPELKKPLVRSTKAWDGWEVQGTGAELPSPVINPQDSSRGGVHLLSLVLQDTFGFRCPES